MSNWESAAAKKSLFCSKPFPKRNSPASTPTKTLLGSGKEKYPGEYIRAAIAEKHGTFTYFRSARDWRFRRPVPAKSQYRLPCVSLDGLLEAQGTKAQSTFGSKVLLWADCEGGELAALRGGKKFMESVQWSWMETTDAPEFADWPDSQQVIDAMSDLGFRAWFRSGYYFPPRWSGDTLFCRRD